MLFSRIRNMNQIQSGVTRHYRTPFLKTKVSSRSDYYKMFYIKIETADENELSGEFQKRRYDWWTERTSKQGSLFVAVVLKKRF
jgi:hypothetical protein